MARVIHSRTRPSSPCSVSSMFRHQCRDAPGRRRQIGRKRCARCCKFARIERCARDRQSAFKLAGDLGGELLHPCEPLARAVAEPQIGITLRDIGMRIDRPGRFQDFSCLARLARFRQPPAGQRRGRHQVGRKLDRFQHQRARSVAVDVVKRLRAGGKQHRALAPIVGFCPALPSCDRAHPVPRPSRRRRSDSRAPPARPSQRPGPPWPLPRPRARAAPASLRRCASI